MDHNSSAKKTPRPPSRRSVSILLICVLLAGAAGIAFIWLMVQPRHIVEGMVRIAPVIRNVLTDEPQPDETANYVQFVNTQAMLLMSDEQRLQKIVDDLARRNLAFFNGKPRCRMEKLISWISPRDANAMPDQILREAIGDGDISAAYVPNSELMRVTMKSENAEEARAIVNSFLRNYVGQYGVDATTSENQQITILENQREEIQKRVLEARTRIRDLANEYGTPLLDPRREMEMSRQNMLQSELTRLEAMRIKIEADISVYEKTEKIEMAPDQVVQARTDYINSDPMVKELSTRIVQMELDQIIAGQTQPPADPADAQKDAVLKACREKLQEKRHALAVEFDSSLDSRLKEAARQRVAQAKMEKAQIEAHIDVIRRALNEQEVQTVKVGNINLDIQDLQRKLELDEEVLGLVNRRLRSFEMERDRRPRVQIASLAEVTGREDPRWRWTFIVLGAVGLLGVILLIRRRVVKPPLQPSSPA